jgi:hypothetical protein
LLNGSLAKEHLLREASGVRISNLARRRFPLPDAVSIAEFELIYDVANGCFGHEPESFRPFDADQPAGHADQQAAKSIAVSVAAWREHRSARFLLTLLFR